MQPAEKDPLYHFLIASEIVFSQKDQEQIHAIRLNSVVTSKTLNLPARMVGKAQQSAQIQFFQRMGDETINVRDVVIITITNLGLMTEEEFQQPPEGMKLQEKPKNED
jgi:hypothetical protein